MCLALTGSISLQATRVNDIGRLLSTTPVLPFLCTGGNNRLNPVIRCVKMEHNGIGRAKVCFNFLNNSGGNLSGPTDKLGFRF